MSSLAELVAGSAVTELTVRRGERSITVRRCAGASPAAAEVSVTAPTTTAIRPAAAPDLRPEVGLLPAAAETDTALVPVGANGSELSTRFEILRAHRVGVFHRGAAEAGEPLIRVGERVARQQQLGCIESMKVFDEIDSPLAGEVVGIFVADGAPVQYGQELFHIRLHEASPAAGEEAHP